MLEAPGDEVGTPPAAVKAVSSNGGPHALEAIRAWEAERGPRLVALLGSGQGFDDIVLLAGPAAERIPAARLLLEASCPGLVARLGGNGRAQEIELPCLSIVAARALVDYSCGVPEPFRDCLQDDELALAALLRPDEARSPAERREPCAPQEPTASRGLGGLHGVLAVVVSSCVLVAALAAYAPLRSFNMEMGGFFMDDAMIRRNAVVVDATLDWRRLMRTDYWGLEMFDPQVWTHKSFRPLAVLTFRWNFLAHGFNNAGFHLSNGAMHASVCAQLGYFAYSALRLPLVWSTLVAAAFAVHPVHTESICYVVGRADLLCAQALLLAAQLYGPCAQAKCCGPLQGMVRLALAVAFIVMAGLCKETGFTFFGLFVVWEGIAILRSGPAVRSLHRWFRIACLLVVGAAACAARMWYTSGTSIARMDPYSNPISASEDRCVRLLSYALVHGMYMKLLAWPSFLCYDYSMDAVPLVHSLTDVRLLLTCAGYLGIVAVGCVVFGKLHARAPKSTHSDDAPAEAAVLGLATFALSFLPMTNILFPIGTMIAERLLYLPSLGILLLAASLAHLWTRRSRLRAKLAIAGAAVATGAMWPLCYWRVAEWSTVDTITLADGLKQLRSTRTQFNLANVYMLSGRMDEALVAYKRANALDPQERDSMPLYHAGQILMYQGQYHEAEKYLQKAVAGYFSPLTLHEEEVWHDYGLALWHTGRGMEAVQNFQNAIITNPGFPKGYNNLGCALAMLGLSQQPPNTQFVQQGLQALEQALALNANVPLYWRNAAAVLGLAGNSEASMRAWDRLRQLDPGTAAQAEVSGGMPRDCVWEFYFR